MSKSIARHSEIVYHLCAQFSHVIRLRSSQTRGGAWTTGVKPTSLHGAPKLVSDAPVSLALPACYRPICRSVLELINTLYL